MTDPFHRRVIVGHTQVSLIILIQSLLLLCSKAPVVDQPCVGKSSTCAMAHQRRIFCVTSDSSFCPTMKALRNRSIYSNLQTASRHLYIQTAVMRQAIWKTSSTSLSNRKNITLEVLSARYEGISTLPKPQ